MARPKGPNSGYQMGIHKMGKYQYASTERTVTGKNGKPIPKHVHWGRLDDKKLFHPNERFLFEKPSEKAKFVYPSDWDLSLVNMSAVNTAESQADPGVPSVETPQKPDTPTTVFSVFPETV